VHYLAQQVAYPEGSRVGDLAGVQNTMDALARIESSSGWMIWIQTGVR
jgi:hypothetical protein